jgi:MraZ protein
VRFIATYETGIDDKRRITVPAEFRNTLRHMNPNAPDTVYLWQSKQGDSLECAGEDFIDRLERQLDRLSEEDPSQAAALIRLIYGASKAVVLDSGGRFVIPEHFCKIVGLKERAVFAGEGAYFRLSSPAANEAIDARLRDIANEDVRDRVFALARRRTVLGGEA